MRTSGAILIAALFANNDVAAFSRAYPIAVENKRATDVVLEYSTFETEEQARSPVWVGQRRQRGELPRKTVRPGRTEYLSGDEYQPWMLWCLVEPPSSLPCEVLNVRRATRNGILFE